MSRKPFKLTPMNQRRLQRFKANRRGWYSLWIFTALFIVSLGAELIANDKPLLIKFDDQYYFPVLFTYAEQEFGGELPTEADYRDEYVLELIQEKGWIMYPPVRFSYNTINYD
ncbi:MAG TPA: ABC transporter permease, partial [Candidatus Kapabacteria bacterium]|nr:ABC transporter permease [Candidatus Kapabacteria bacterium]